MMSLHGRIIVINDPLPHNKNTVQKLLNLYLEHTACFIIQDSNVTRQNRQNSKAVALKLYNTNITNFLLSNVL